MSTVVFTIISAIKRAKFHLSIIIITEIAFLVMLFILYLLHTAGSVHQMKNK